MRSAQSGAHGPLARWVVVADTSAVQAETQYAKSGDVSIAYQVVGDGAFDVVLVAGLLARRAGMVASPPPRRGAAPTVRVRAADLLRPARHGYVRPGQRGVARDADGRHARGHGRRRLEAGRPLRMAEGGAISLVFAATYPERTSALVLFARGSATMWAADYPWGLTEEQASAMRRACMQLFFGSRQEALEVARLWRGPGLERRRACRGHRLPAPRAAVRGTMEAYRRMLREIDVRQVLPGDPRADAPRSTAPRHRPFLSTAPATWPGRFQRRGCSSCRARRCSRRDADLGAPSTRRRRSSARHGSRARG